MIRVLIVDDEPLARWRIRDLLNAEDGIDVVSEADNGERAIQQINLHRPDLVFLDGEMPDLSGIDVIQAIGPASMPLTIFVTAHDYFAVPAFGCEALDYVLKPFDRERFSAAVARARRRLEAPLQSAAYFHALLDQTMPEHLVSHQQGRTRVIPLVDVYYITAAGHYAEVRTRRQEFLVNDSLSSLHKRLSRSGFARVHRSTIVRLEKIREVRLESHGDGAIILEDGIQVRVSRRYRHAVDQFLQGGTT